MINNKINEDLFFNLYKSKDIIYPRAVARHFNINLQEACIMCHERVGKDLRELYMIQCLVCSHTLSERFYAIQNINTDFEYGCNNCDTEFIANEKNIIVNFEKI